MDDNTNLVYDNDMQVWVRDGVIEPCAHPASMRTHGRICCNGHLYAGYRIRDIEQGRAAMRGATTRRYPDRVMRADY